MKLSLVILKIAFGAFCLKLFNLYGPTEAAIDVTWWQCTPIIARIMFQLESLLQTRKFMSLTRFWIL